MLRKRIDYHRLCEATTWFSGGAHAAALMRSVKSAAVGGYRAHLRKHTQNLPRVIGLSRCWVAGEYWRTWKAGCGPSSNGRSSRPLPLRAETLTLALESPVEVASTRISSRCLGSVPTNVVGNERASGRVFSGSLSSGSLPSFCRRRGRATRRSAGSRSLFRFQIGNDHCRHRLSTGGNERTRASSTTTSFTSWGRRMRWVSVARLWLRPPAHVRNRLS